LQGLMFALSAVVALRLRSRAAAPHIPMRFDSSVLLKGGSSS